MKFTKWGGKTTSLSKIVSMPKGFITAKLTGLLFNGITNYLVIGLVIKWYFIFIKYYFYKILKKGKGGAGRK